MKEKKVFFCEVSYVVGVVVLALGTALMERADFGMSMVVAPAYLLHLKVSQFLPFFSFGMAEYLFQALVLCVLSLVMGKVKKSYFLSFATAVLYGLVLDATISIIGLIPLSGPVWQGVFYVVGLVTCSIGVAFLFHTYFPPAAYELFVKEISQKLNAAIGKTKTIYDCCSCILGVILSLCFFGTFLGVKWGTIVCAIVNGWLIGRISRLLEKKYDFKDALPWRKRIS